MACKYEVWQSLADGRWYWHLLDAQGVLVAEGGGGYPSMQDAIDEMQRMEDCLGAAASLEVVHIYDPNV